MLTRARADWRAVADWTPVIAVGAVSSSGLGLEHPWSGSDLGLAVTALLLALPLAIRRRRPLATAALVAAALVVQVMVGGSLHFGAFVAVLTTAYAAGRWAQGAWRGPVAVGVVLVGALGANLGDLLDSPADAAFPVFYVTAAAALGRVVRRLAAQAERLTRLNAALERERDTSARLAVTAERMRLSRDLHDSIAHTLTVTVVQAEAAEAALADHPDRARDGLRRIQEAGRRGLSDLRGTLRVLRSSDEPRCGSLHDLPALTAVLAESGLEVAVDLETDLDAIRPELSTDLFRLAQEALTNVARHSAATSARIGVARSGDELRVLVSDPGPPLVSELPPGGHGVTGMTERLSRHGGTVTAGPGSDGGWTVRATVPRTGRVGP